MKDYVLENLELELGDQLEEVLSELFYVPKEEGVTDYFLEESIYDLSSETDIKFRLLRDQEFLDEGSASLENLELLESQARSYFKSPRSYSIEEGKQAEVTGFIQYLAEMSFNQDGQVEQKWRSAGLKIKLNVEDLLFPERVISQIEQMGVEFNDLTRIVFYGFPLEDLVGCRFYTKGQKRDLESLSSEFTGILLAVPDYSDCSRYHKSIFESIEELFQEEVPFGNELSIPRVSSGHYELTLQCLEEVRLRELEETKSERLEELEAKRSGRKVDFDLKFKEPREIISSLNANSIRISDLANIEVPVLGQALWLAEKKGERIEKPIKYYQLKSLFKKKKAEELSEVKSGMRTNIIDQVNSGYPVEVHLLDYEELDITFAILWGGGARIKQEYKDIYFKLKERYLHLKSIKDAA